MLRNMLGIGMLLNTDSFKKGQQAAENGRDASENPYTEGSGLWSDWQMGWRVAAKMAAINENRDIAQTVPAASAYEMGQAAAAKGLSVTVNPYHYGNPAHDKWRLGWARQKAS